MNGFECFSLGSELIWSIMQVSHHKGIFRYSRFDILFVSEYFAKGSRVEAIWRESEKHFAVVPRSFKPFSTKHVACGLFLALRWETCAFKCVTKHKVGEQVTALCTGSGCLNVCIFKQLLAHLKSSCKPWAVFTAVVTG